MTYKAILFDLDNTLLDFSACELDAMQRATAQYGVSEWEGFQWDSFWQTFLKRNLFYWEERIVRKLTVHEVLEFALRDTFEGLGKDGELPARLSSTYWELFCNTCHFEPGAPELLALLKLDYKLGIVSNGTGEAQHLRLKKGSIHHYFDSIVVSDEVGYWKPDPLIFETILDRMGLGRGDVLFVGDSLRDDYEGARRAGIDFCYYNRRRESVPESISPMFTIQSLPELPDRLRGHEPQ